MKKERTSVQFTYERTYTVRRPRFKLFNNVRYLDTARLSRGSHTIELGKFEGCNCDCAVTAKISDGMIKGINNPKCKSATKIPPQLARKLQAARMELRKNSQPKWEDVPVHELTRSSARARIIIVITTDGDCFELCVGPPGHQICMLCCDDWCIGPSDPHLAVL